MRDCFQWIGMMFELVEAVVNIDGRSELFRKPPGLPGVNDAAKAVNTRKECWFRLS